MRKQSLSITTFCIISLFSCSTNRGSDDYHQNEEGLIKINIGTSINKERPSFKLSEVVDSIKIIPLQETNVSIVGKIMDIQVIDEDYYIASNTSSGLLRFNSGGFFENSIGKQGQGPDEYVRMLNYFIDKEKKEINIISTIKGIQTYDRTGNHIRYNPNFKIGSIMRQTITKLYSFKEKLIMEESGQFLPNNVVEADSIWQFALLDSSFVVYKKFYNPSHKGNEEEIISHPVSMNSLPISWIEEKPSVDFYNNEMWIKYPDVDTLYKFNSKNENIESKYYLDYGNLTRTDHMSYNVVPKEKSAFYNLRLFSFYNTHDYFYFVGNKSDDIYTFQYSKKTGRVIINKRKGLLYQSNIRFDNGNKSWAIKRDFILKNDICGGQFRVDFTCGNYWVFVLTHESIEDVLQLKEADVKDITLFTRLKEEVERMRNNDDANPILMVAKLK